MIFNTNGVNSLTPTSLYMADSNKTQRIEDVVELKLYFVTPHTPYWEKFLAIAIWI
jgi:hypothetical protein